MQIHGMAGSEAAFERYLDDIASQVVAANNRRRIEIMKDAHMALGGHLNDNWPDCSVEEFTAALEELNRRIVDRVTQIAATVKVPQGCA